LELLPVTSSKNGPEKQVRLRRRPAEIGYNSTTMKSATNSQFPISAAYGLAVTNALIIRLSFSFVKIAVTLAGLIDRSRVPVGPETQIPKKFSGVN